MILESVDSTNAEIRRRLEANLLTAESAHGFWISAKKQTAGRGRQGRAWISSEGGLYFSILLRSETMNFATWIPLMVAVSVVKILNEKNPSKPVAIKWPNDLYVEGEKLGGILVEGMGSSTDQFSFIAGVGLNVNDSPQNIDQPTTWLKKYLPQFDLDLFRVELVQQILADFEKLKTAQLGEIRERYLKQSYFSPGVEVTWYSAGEPAGQGQVLGIGEQGQLLVTTSLGEYKALYAADVKIRKRL